MTKEQFIQNVRKLLRSLGQISPRASDEEVYCYGLAICEWTIQEAEEKGHEEAWRAVIRDYQDYFKARHEEAAEYFAAYK